MAKNINDVIFEVGTPLHRLHLARYLENKKTACTGKDILGKGRLYTVAVGML